MPTLDRQQRAVLKRLHDSGYEAYLVGGCLRDMLMGRQYTDIDVATDALPDEITAVFADCDCYRQGEKFGTVGVIFNGARIEITAFRTDGDYADSRHPDSVCFTRDLHTDLARRDFTVNSLAYDGRGDLVDDFGGADDLKNGILRATGDARRRFSEDALRIMRLFRFCAQLGFTADPDTLAAAVALREKLSSIAVERVREEMLKLLSCADVLYSCKLLSEYDILQFIGIRGGFDAAAVSQCPPDPLLRLAVISVLTGCDDAQTARSLKLSNYDRIQLRSFTRFITREFTDKTDFKRCMAALASRDWEKVEAARSVLGRPHAPIGEWLAEVMRRGEPYKLSQLAVSGSDAVNAGIEGRAVGEAMDACLNRVIEIPSDNNREALLALLSRLAAQNGDLK